MTKKLFGTDGVRGEANRYPMTPELAMRLGMAVTHLFRRETHQPKIVLGKDTRVSGYMLENALVSGITAMGGRVVALGPIPTPGVAHLTVSMRADAGIMLSASHNPFHDNGIKVFGRDGFKLDDALEVKIEKLMDELARSPEKMAKGKEIGRSKRIEDATGRYVSYLKHSFPNEYDLDGLKVVVDSANGAGYRTAPVLFEELGATLFHYGAAPNGVNINDRCGSLHPSLVQEKVLAHGADLGVALDGDADRLTLVDEKGNILDGNAILYIMSRYLKIRKRLNKNTLVTTSMANMGMENSLRRSGIQLLRTQVGDRYVVEAMRKEGLNLGGEPSGHVIFLDSNTTADGLLTALQMIAVMKSEDKPLSALAPDLEIYPQILLNVAVREKRPFDDLEGYPDVVRKVQNRLGAKGRLEVRYSGTENVARVMCEGESQEIVETIAEEVASHIRLKIGQA